MAEVLKGILGTPFQGWDIRTRERTKSGGAWVPRARVTYAAVTAPKS